MSDPTPLAQSVIDALRRRRYRYSCERTLHLALSQALTDAHIEHTREVSVVGGRIDFLADRLGIEVKIKGSTAAVARQLSAYANDPGITELLLVTTRPRHRAVTASIDTSTPVHVLTIGGLSL